MAYWLGGEWGVFQSSYFVINRALPQEERRRHIETAYRIDILARTGIILLLPLGLQAPGIGYARGADRRRSDSVARLPAISRRRCGKLNVWPDSRTIMRYPGFLLVRRSLGVAARSSGRIAGGLRSLTFRALSGFLDAGPIYLFLSALFSIAAPAADMSLPAPAVVLQAATNKALAPTITRVRSTLGSEFFIAFSVFALARMNPGCSPMVTRRTPPRASRTLAHRAASRCTN